MEVVGEVLLDATDEFSSCAEATRVLVLLHTEGVSCGAASNRLRSWLFNQTS